MVRIVLTVGIKTYCTNGRLCLLLFCSFENVIHAEHMVYTRPQCQIGIFDEYQKCYHSAVYFEMYTNFYTCMIHQLSKG